MDSQVLAMASNNYCLKQNNITKLNMLAGGTVFYQLEAVALIVTITVQYECLS